MGVSDGDSFSYVLLHYSDVTAILQSKLLMSALVIKNVAHDGDGERLEVVFCLDIRRMKLKNRTS